MFIFALFTNLIILGLQYENADAYYLEAINTLYQAWSIFFAMDTTLKLLALGIVRYFGSTWRRIEFLVSLESMFDLILDYRSDWYHYYLVIREDDPYFIWLRLLFILRDVRILLII